MSLYNQEFNKDNTILRYIIVSLLAELKEKVYYFNQVDEDNLVKINIPFLYSITGNERFLLDNFLYEAIDNDQAIGDYEVVPRGIVQLGSMTIDSGSLTNKFIRSEFVREYQGKLKTFSLETMFLPLDLSFSVTLVCSNNLEMLKATESVISKLYKSTVFHVDLGMMRVEATVQVPEDYSQERLFEFTINDKKEFNVTFSLDVKTFMPVFQDGFLLSEISKITKDSINNTNAKGIGMFRNGNIYFGGVLQQFEHTVDDIDKAPSEDMLSNKSYKDKELINRGDVYLDFDTTSKKTDEESDDSKEYRNDK